MATRIYHWKHGWIPLDHAAAMSKSKGSEFGARRYLAASHAAGHAHGSVVTGEYGGGTHVRGLKPVARDHLPRESHIIAAHNDSTRTFALLDHKTGNTATMPEHVGDRLHADNYTIQSVLTGTGGTFVKVRSSDGQSHVLRADGTDLGRVLGPAGQPKPTPTKPSLLGTSHAAPEFNAENVAIAPAGYTIDSKYIGTKDNGARQAMHHQRTAAGERVGSVVDRRDGGGFKASYQGHEIGTFTTRQEAHQALADAHNAIAEAARAKSDAAARRHASAVPIGAFQPHTPRGDGTARGDAAAAKIKQSFTLNNHKVHIETAMTKEQTKALLDDIHSVLLKSDNIDHPHGVTFHVPSGDSKFRQTRRSITGGYVRRGQRTIFINPKVANGQAADTFGGPGVGESLMPIAKETSGRQYVITHELGHVVDNEHQHTAVSFERTPSGLQIPTGSPSQARTLARENVSHLSRYGRTNPSEAYAEAYAQWVHGGPGSSLAADSYAAAFGWVVPKWYREGRRR